MVLTSRNKSVSDIDIRINNVSIERVYVPKFLDILIDYQLNWKHHIEYTCKNYQNTSEYCQKPRKNCINRRWSHCIIILLILTWFIVIRFGEKNYPTIINKLVLIHKTTCKDNYLLPLQSPHWTIDVCQQNFITNWYQYISYWNNYVSVHAQRSSWIVLKFLQYK